MLFLREREDDVVSVELRTGVCVCIGCWKNTAPIITAYLGFIAINGQTLQKLSVFINSFYPYPTLRRGI